jgi:hypothetical protein
MAPRTKLDAGLLADSFGRYHAEPAKHRSPSILRENVSPLPPLTSTARPASFEVGCSVVDSFVFLIG